MMGKLEEKKIRYNLNISFFEMNCREKRDKS